MNKITPRFSLILPVHNQESIIKPVVKEIIDVLETIKITFEIIMVENGSTDDTLTVLKKMEKSDSRIHTNIAPQGYGSAVLAGLNIAKGDMLGYMPSDGQIENRILPVLISEFQSGKYDLVKIYRTTRESNIRFLRSKVFNLMGNIIFGKLPIIDINGSPRIFKQNKFKLLDLTFTDSFIDLEFALKARYLGWRIKEIPMKTLPRAGGQSTVSIKTIFEFIRNMTTYRFGAEFEDWKKRINA